jgi:nucleotide-binding universal stress UspA family protein
MLVQLRIGDTDERLAMIEIQRILCPVDFSKFSRRALDYAVTLARWYKAKLTVLHVYEVVPLAPVAPEMIPGFALGPEYRDSLMRELERFAEPSGADAVPLEVVLAEGHAGHEIVTRAGADGSGLIVLGTHGRTGVERFFLGSVTERVLHRARCPVLAVPPHAAAVPPAPVFKRILCGLDFSTCSLQGLEYALSLAQEAGASLTLAHVFETDASMPEDWRTSLKPDAVREALVALETERRARLAQAVPQNLERSCSVDTVMACGPAARELLRLAETRVADLIVLGVQGRNAADLLLFGSTSNKVVRRAACPVLVVNKC